jgi:hypothetical protein
MLASRMVRTPTGKDTNSNLTSTDLDAIKVHLGRLKEINDPKPLLHQKLIARLDGNLQRVNTPDPNNMPPPILASLNGDDSWNIFDQASLEQINFASWPGTVNWNDTQV